MKIEKILKNNNKFIQRVNNCSYVSLNKGDKKKLIDIFVIINKYDMEFDILFYTSKMFGIYHNDFTFFYYMTRERIPVCCNKIQLDLFRDYFDMYFKDYDQKTTIDKLLELLMSNKINDMFVYAYIKTHDITQNDAMHILDTIIFIHDIEEIKPIVNVLFEKKYIDKVRATRLILNNGFLIDTVFELNIHNFGIDNFNDFNDIVLNALISGKYENSSIINRVSRDRFYYNYFPDICKYQPVLLKNILCRYKNEEIFFNDICDVFVENSSDTYSHVLRFLIEDGYYVDNHTYYLAKKYGNIKLAQIIKDHLDNE
jgi:hypothetical protein